MFESIEKDKKFQCSSEFGLYRCEDSEDDCYSMKKKTTKFGFHYLVVLLTSVIVLSAICLVTYNYISESKTTPRLKFNNNNDSNNEEKNVTITILPMTNFTEISPLTTSGPLDYPEPLAMKLHNSRRKSEDPRPFIYEIRDPQPVGFQYPTSSDQSYQAVNVSPYRHKAKNIQEIIKLLEQSQEENGGETSKKKKKHSRRRGNNLSYIQDPFFPYKPQNPSDINLLATNSFRFAPAVQLEIKKPPAVNEQYPKYENPNQPEIPLTLTLDVQNNQQYTNKRHKKQKPINYNNLYNQNNYFNQLNRFQQNRIQPNWNNRPYWNVANLNRKNKQNDFVPHHHPMIVHLNVFPKKKKKHSNKDQRISESNIHQNCTDNWEEDEKYSQIKNASEFNQLLEKVRHSYLDHSNDKVTINDKEDLYRIKNTFLQLDQSDQDKMNEYLPNNENVEVQKSIGFTVINPNFSTINENSFESQWRPIAVESNNNYFNDDNRSHDNHQDDVYDLEVGEVNEDRHEPVTLPLPNEIFQKYFNTKPTPKYNNDWDFDTVQQNPNLVNHRPSFEDGRDE